MVAQNGYKCTKNKEGDFMFLLTCTSCAFYYELGNRSDPEIAEWEKHDGMCRRYPPKKLELSNNGDWDLCPIIRDAVEHVCGEYKPRFKFKHNFTLADAMEYVFSVGGKTCLNAIEKQCTDYQISFDQLMKNLHDKGLIKVEGEKVIGISIRE